jgi:hypothetical protein
MNKKIKLNNKKLMNLQIDLFKLDKVLIYNNKFMKLEI